MVVCGLVSAAMFAGSVLAISREAVSLPDNPAATQAVVAGSTSTTFAEEDALTFVRLLATMDLTPELPAVTTEVVEGNEEPEAALSSAASRDWDSDDSYRLMKIAMAEAEGESVEGKALVMLVVLNRVWSDQFPNTIEEVIFQRNQFSPVKEGGRWYTTEPNEECAEALELVMNGWDESEGALYFESCKADSWHSKHLEFLFQYGNHKFYR